MENNQKRALRHLEDACVAARQAAIGRRLTICFTNDASFRQPRRCGKKCCAFFIAPDCFFFCSRSGSREQACRAPPQAGYDFAEYDTEQKVHRRWRVHKQKSNRWHILFSREIQFQELFQHAPIFCETVRFSIFPRHPDGARYFIAATDRKLTA